MVLTRTTNPLRAMRVRQASGLLLLALADCSTQVPPPTPAPMACTQVGMASWYPGVRDRQVPSDALVAAHPTLPFGTAVQVTVIESGRSVVVRITDRGPYAKGRIIDLSTAAAERLGMRQDGVAQVRLQIEQPAEQTCPFTNARLGGPATG